MSTIVPIDTVERNVTLLEYPQKYTRNNCIVLMIGGFCKEFLYAVWTQSINEYIKYCFTSGYIGE